MAGFDRSRINLGRRTQQQTDTRESSGGVGRQGYMNYASCGLKFFKMAEPGTYHDLNILPWKIGTKNHPEVVAGNAQVGDWDYVLDLMVHTRIGPGQGDYICPKKNFGKPCPICERADDLWKNDDTKDEARKLFARRKCTYLVQELDENFHAKSETPLIFDVSHMVFSKELQSRATSCLRGKGVVNFADPGDEGKVVSFSVNEATMGNGKKFKEAGNFEFNERVEEISDEILEKCPSLDKMMVVKSYDQLKAALYGDPEDAENDYDNQQGTEEAEQPPSRFRDNAPARFEEDDAPSDRRRNVEEDEAEGQPARRRRNVDEEEAPANTPRHREAKAEEDAPRRRLAPVEKEEQPAPRRRNADVEEDSSENAYQEARRTSRKRATEDTPTMPFDDEPQDEAPAEEAAPKASRGASVGECPNGYEFGVDCDNQPLCSKCNDNIWAKCSECKRKMKKK